MGAAASLHEAINDIQDSAIDRTVAKRLAAGAWNQTLDDVFTSLSDHAGKVPTKKIQQIMMSSVPTDNNPSDIVVKRLSVRVCLLHSFQRSMWLAKFGVIGRKN